MRKTISSLAAAALLALSAAPAMAADEGQHPAPGAIPETWANYVNNVKEQNAAQDWSTARGAIVADTGFRPYTDGFSFFNWGAGGDSNSVMFGTPKKWDKNLSSEGMRQLFGKKVCIGKNADGTCRLTLSGKQWRDSENKSMSGGHCFGLAATSSLMFTQMLQPTTYQADAATTYDLLFKAPISREISRFFVTQDTIQMSDYYVTAKEAVELLKKNLQPGTSPYVLAMWTAEGGHGVTPFALSDAGDGQYDILIYDNNYPDYQRVIRVDTVKDQASYAFSVNPQEPPVAPELSQLALVPNSELAKKQPCPFCPDSKTTTVQFAPVKTQVPLKTKITRLNGKPLKGVTRNRATNPWQPGKRWSFPTFTMRSGKSFLVRVGSKKSKKTMKVSMLATTGRYQVETDDVKIPKRGFAKIGVDTKTNTVVYRSKKPSMGTVSFTDTEPERIVTVDAVAGSETALSVGGSLSKKREAVAIVPFQKRPGKVYATMALEYYRNGKARTVQARTRAMLPTDGALVLRYKKWSGKNKRAVKAYVVDGKRSKRVPVQFG